MMTDDLKVGYHIYCIIKIVCVLGSYWWTFTEIQSYSRVVLRGFSISFPKYPYYQWSDFCPRSVRLWQDQSNFPGFVVNFIPGCLFTQIKWENTCSAWRVALSWFRFISEWPQSPLLGISISSRTSWKPGFGVFMPSHTFMGNSLKCRSCRLKEE